MPPAKKHNSRVCLSSSRELYQGRITRPQENPRDPTNWVKAPQKLKNVVEALFQTNPNNAALTTTYNCSLQLSNIFMVRLIIMEAYFNMAAALWPYNVQ